MGSIETAIIHPEKKDERPAGQNAILAVTSMNKEILKNHPLKYAAEEFSLANDAYKRMRQLQVGDFEEFERAWRDFLHRVERIWIKTQQAVNHLPNWQRVASPIISLRQNDPLLNYIRQARNADQHTIAEVAISHNLVIDAKPHIRGITITGNYNNSLLPVQNRGITYSPPKFHLGKPLNAYEISTMPEPLLVATLAMRFYCDVLNQVSEHVVGDVGEGGTIQF
jgi:hypothetical protein